MTETVCKWTSSTTPRVVVGQHRDDCGDLACLGCLKCPENHCVCCCKEHATNAHPLTCADCVKATREDLAAIVELARHLRDQAANAGNDGRLLAAAPIPGGDAMVLMSPSGEGDIQVRQAMHTVNEADRLEQPDRKKHAFDHLDDESRGDPEPPLLLLANLEDIWRDTLGQPKAQGRATIRGSAGYLDQQLTWAAQRPDIDMPDFAATLRRMRGRLEDTLQDGKRSETGAPCISCGTELTHRANDRQDTCDCPPRKPHTRHELHPFDHCCLQCRVDAKHQRHDQGGLRDEWLCRGCERRYDESEYKDRVVALTYAQHAPARISADLTARYDLKPATLRKWVERGKVRRRGRNLEGKLLYDVGDVEKHLERDSSECA
jgi:hypothetical protein